MPRTGITIPSEPCTLFDDRKPRQFVDTQVRSHPVLTLASIIFLLGHLLELRSCVVDWLEKVILSLKYEKVQT